MLRSLLIPSTLSSTLIAVLLWTPLEVKRAPLHATAADTTGLLRFVGTWIGAGTGLGGAIIRDSLVFMPALGGRALRFTMVATSADGFEAEGYVWRAEPTGPVELIETSSADPMRRFRGSWDTQALVLDEEPAARATQVRLEFLSADSLRLQEMSTRSQPPRAFVDEVFVRVGP
jgi:hypothetical protein